MESELIIKAVDNLWGQGVQQREESIKYLQSMDPQEVLPILKELLESDNLERQSLAAQMLVILAPSRIDEVLFLLDSPESWVRYNFCGFLIDYGYTHKRTIEILIRAASSDPDPNVRGIACEALGWIGDVSCIDPLTEIACYDEEINTHSEPIRNYAVRALATLARRFFRATDSE